MTNWAQIVTALYAYDRIHQVRILVFYMSMYNYQTAPVSLRLKTYYIIEATYYLFLCTSIGRWLGGSKHQAVSFWFGDVSKSLGRLDCGIASMNKHHHLMKNIVVIIIVAKRGMWKEETRKPGKKKKEEIIIFL